MSAARLLGVVLVAGLGSLWPAGHASAGEERRVTPTTEAWYQPNPSCGQPTGCLNPGAPNDPPGSPFPAGSLHVGWSAGAETARSYLALPLRGILGTPVAATLEVPLDTSSASGSQRPETASLQVCPFGGDLAPVEGSFDAPPPASCQTPAWLTYVPLPTPHLYGNLTPLLPSLLTSTGVAVLPRPGSGSALWRVVFSAHTRTTGARTGPATVSLSFADPAVADPDQQRPPAIGPAPVAPSLPLTGGGGFAAAPRPALTAAPAPRPQLAPVERTGAATTARLRGQPSGVEYAYPGVWLLPLALLVFVPVTAKALTRDLTPTSPLGRTPS